MEQARYIRRRSEIQDYFDRTAIHHWKKLATDEPLNRIRETVRAGRDRMRGLLLSCLPNDLSGWRVLDAGCGAGMMSAELARRGADVVAVDLSPEIVRYAATKLAAEDLKGSVTFHSGDMLSAEFGRFDAVVAMDSLIHYKLDDAVQAMATLAARTDKKIVCTFAPRTVPLTLMHMTGRLFPRSDRAPSIQPTAPKKFRKRLLADPAFADWQVGLCERVKSGFYTSQAIEVSRR
ncbi:magnesium protoporphyrin IX methyltransferase [Rhodobium gokarnense]|uniref:Magnesium protoporphyrin IX methyltransferase n=1 Tax=Rhodobium gokarnense TaxID=364296 RepID=A0ABT3HBM5_9HYPH|nr:magnesium protoporphyrin IX methyltransferase [Rhodobium gokarnense]MCW2307785.1 magnesium-protoporphyrin O-methyltransferase [Rhodobium gokarnense]